VKVNKSSKRFLNCEVMVHTKQFVVDLRQQLQMSSFRFSLCCGAKVHISLVLKCIITICSPWLIRFLVNFLCLYFVSQMMMIDQRLQVLSHSQNIQLFGSCGFITSFRPCELIPFPLYAQIIYLLRLQFYLVGY
jgi:hypothetical protein